MWIILLVWCQAESGRVWVYPLRMAYAGVSVDVPTRSRHKCLTPRAVRRFPLKIPEP
jgi:hypothetical protein